MRKKANESSVRVCERARRRAPTSQAPAPLLSNTPACGLLSQLSRRYWNRTSRVLGPPACSDESGRQARRRPSSRRRKRRNPPAHAPQVGQPGLMIDHEQSPIGAALGLLAGDFRTSRIEPTARETTCTAELTGAVGHAPPELRRVQTSDGRGENVAVLDKLPASAPLGQIDGWNIAGCHVIRRRRLRLSSVKSQPRSPPSIKTPISAS